MATELNIPAPWWKRVKQRLVRVLNPRKLEAGKKVKFQDGTVYQMHESGGLRRIYPLKPWGNNAERRRYLKQRRKERAEAAGVEPEYGSYAQE